MSDAPNPIDLKKQLKALLEDQGDYNDLLRNALRDLKQLDNVYDKISARIATMERGTVNLKEVGKELYSLKQKEYLEQKKMEKLEQEFDKSSTEKYNKIVAAAKKYAEIKKARGETYDVEASITKLVQKQPNIEKIALDAQRQFIEIAKKKREEGELALETEKKVGKQIGITGNLFKIFTEKLGVGEDAYEAMTSKARDLVDANGKVTGFGGKMKVLGAGMKAIGEQIKESITDPAAIAIAMVAAYKKVEGAMNNVGNAASNTGKTVAGLSEHSTSAISDITGKVSGLVKQIPFIGGLIGGIMDMFAGLLDFAVGATSHIQAMGRSMGLSASESIKLNNEFSDFATETGKATINSEKLFKTYIAIGEQLGINNQISKENLETAHELQEFAGLEASTIAQLQTVSTISGKSIGGIAKGLAGQLESFKKTTGISFSFKKTMSELAGLSGVLGLQFSKYPGKIMNAFLTTKSLGLELGKVNSMADGFLDFESSISKEFEAQLLTGKDINLQKLRELSLNNDIAGMAAEIAKQVGTSGDFLKMNRIQQNAYAEAVGMSRDEVADMLKQQEQFSKFGAKDVKDLQAKVDLMRQQGKVQEAINLLGSEEAYNKNVAATASDKLSGFIDKIKQSFADLVSNTGFSKWIEDLMDRLSKPEEIMKIVNSIKNTFATIVDVLGSVIGGIMSFLNLFPGIDIDQSMIDMVEGAGSQIRAVNLGSLSTPSVGDNVAKEKTAGTAKPGGESASKGFTPMQKGATVIQNHNTITITGKTTKELTETHIIDDKSRNH